MPAYLDNASSEPLSAPARETLLAALDTGWADPERLHTRARQARLLLDNARAAVAECLGVRADEVSFAASGTDAVHRGVLGLARGSRSGARGCTGRVVVSAIEHSAVFAAATWWTRRAAEGRSVAPAEVTRVPVDSEGRILPDRLVEHLSQPTDLVAVQQTNPEVGTVQDLATVAGIAEERGVPLFVDACASSALAPLPPRWDAVALSAHKWGGPAGVGLLLVSKGSRWRDPYPGDERADPRISGFENVPAALAAASALQVRVAARDELRSRYRALGRRLVDGLRAIADVDVHGPALQTADHWRSPHIVSASFLYVDGEALVHELDRAGFQVASGSACTASSLEPSHVLVAMGALTHGNVRISFGPQTATNDVDRLVAALGEAVSRLRGDLP